MPRCRATPMPTSRSSAPGSPGCGPRTTCCSATRRCASWCSTRDRRVRRQRPQRRLVLGAAADGARRVAARHGESAARAHAGRDARHVAEVSGLRCRRRASRTHATQGGTVTLGTQPRAGRPAPRPDRARSRASGSPTTVPPARRRARRAPPARPTSVVGRSYTPHCATVHPARLTHGARACRHRAPARRSTSTRPSLEIGDRRVVHRPRHGDRRRGRARHRGVHRAARR